MNPFQIEELHHVLLETDDIQNESCLLASSPNGLFFVACKHHLAVFTANDYDKASSSFGQRKDKALPDFQPLLRISLPHRVKWLSVNCAGSLLLLAYNSSVQLLNIQLLSAQQSHGLIGEPWTLPNVEGSIRDLAWNPADRQRFALITTAGSVHMFTVNLQQASPFNPVGYLPASVQARCLSWSPKGKQLALVVTGSGWETNSSSKPAAANSSNGTMSIVQVDHDLKVKRVIRVGDLVKGQLKNFTEPRPVDILWTSSYCFLLGVEDVVPAHGIHLTFVTALPKLEARLHHLPEFAGFGESLRRYQMRLLPNSTLVALTWSCDAEECYLLEVPAVTSAAESPAPDSLPKLVRALPLPTYASPAAIDVGALADSSGPLPLVLGLLTNGALFAFEILPPKSGQMEASSRIFAGFRMWCESAEKPPSLSPALAQSSTPASPSSITPTSKAATVPESTAERTTTVTSAPTYSFGSLFGKISTSDVNKAVGSTTPSSGAPGGSLSVQPSQPDVAAPTTTVAFPIVFGRPVTSGAATPVSSSSSLAALLQTPPHPVGEKLSTSVTSTPVKPTNLVDGAILPTPEKSPDSDKNTSTQPPSLNQSIVEAASHFSKALQSQADTSAQAWRHLQDVFDGNSENLQQKGEDDVVRRGVLDIEQSLNNMDDFLRVVGEITTELRKASQLSVNEQRASADFLDRLNVDFDAFCYRLGGTHQTIAAAGLDPEAAAMLFSLRRKSRIAEGFLADLEDQVESLSAQLEALTERDTRALGKNKSCTALGDVGSPLDKIQATLAANARIIKCERSRLDLISRMAGISLDDSPPNTSKHPVSATSLGGSVVCVDREQRDVQLYRLLCGGEKFKSKVTAGKNGALERVPVVKASSTVAEVLETLRKAAEAAKSKKEKENLRPMKLAPKAAVKSSANVAGATSPRTASQMNSPGQQKNLEISKLLASAASVPPVTLASVDTNLRGNGSSLTTAPKDSSPFFPQASTAPTKPKSLKDVLTKSSTAQTPSSPVVDTSKPAIFVPSTTLSFTSPTRTSPIPAPTTKVFGAPMGSSGIENFVPLSQRIASSTSAGDTPLSPRKPQASSSPFGQLPVSTTAPSTPTSDGGSPPRITTATATSTAVKPESGRVVTTVASTPFTGSLFGSSLSSTSFADVSNKEKTVSPAPATPSLQTATSATAPLSPGCLFGMKPATSAASPPSTSGQSPAATETKPALAFGSLMAPATATATAPAPAPAPAAASQPSQPPKAGGASGSNLVFGTTDSTAPAKQPVQFFGGSTATTTSSQPTQLFGTSVAAKASTSPSSQTCGAVLPTATTSGPPNIVFGGPVAATPTSQTSHAFGLSPSTPATSASGGLFARPVISSPPGQSGGLFAPPAATTCSPSQALFGKPSESIAGGLFGQSTTGAAQAKGTFFGQATPPSTQAGGLFGSSLVTASSQPSSLFGQTAITTAAQTTAGLFGSSTTVTAGLFGQSFAPKPGTPFGQSPPQSGGLFGQAASGTAPSPGGLFGQASPNTQASSGGLFGSMSSNGGEKGGTLFASSKLAEGSSGLLFGSSASATTVVSNANTSSLQHVNNVSNLFAMSTFGLGTSSSSSSAASSTTTAASAAAAPTNVFGKPASAAAALPMNSSNVPARNLFGASTSSSTTGGFGATTKPGSLFGPSTLTAASGGLFGSQTTTTASASSGAGGLFSGGGGLFSNSPAAPSAPLFGGPAFGSSGGLFGLSTASAPTTGGFGAAPSFGAPAVFGGSPFGGVVGSAGPSASGVGNTTGAGGLFASLGSSAGGVSFGGLANAASQQAPTPLFGSSPSFTQRRA